MIEHGPTYGSLGASRGLEHWLVQKLDAEVRLVEREGEGPRGQPWQLELTHGQVHILIRHLLEEPQLHVTVTLDDRCLLPHCVQASRGTRAGLLAAAMDVAW